jgi:hypothetical protein
MSLIGKALSRPVREMPNSCPECPIRQMLALIREDMAVATVLPYFPERVGS